MSIKKLETLKIKIKSVSILCLIITILPAVIYSNIFVEFDGGAGSLNMADYNSSIDSANTINQSEGYISKLEKINFSFLPEINAGMLVGTGIGLFGLYLKNDAIINYGSGGDATLTDGTKIFIMDRDLTVFYSGPGIRRYFLQGENEKINAYIGVDAGFYYSFGNNINEKAYNADGSPWYDVEKNWSVFYPGGCAEAGTTWQYDMFGLNLKAGYRFGLCRALVNTKNSLYGYNISRSWYVFDYSGFYACAGIVITFDPWKNAGREFITDSSKPFSSITAQFYNDGVDLFEKGKYKDAEKKLNDAKKLDPDNKQIDEYLNRISILTTELNKEETIEKKLELADKLRSAGNISEALIKYKEALAMDPQNKQALFYTGEFEKQAGEFKAVAEDAYVKGRLKKALKNIQEALKYAPDDKEISGLMDKITKNISDKKQATELFNTGVENFQKGDYSGAIKLWEKVLELSPGDEEAKKNINMAKDKLTQENKTTQGNIDEELKGAKELYEKGILDEAKSKYELILRMDSGNTEAAEMMKKIEELEKQDNNGSVKKR